ncbi:PEP-CTERM sorting domain-containing protein [bacterium]|nr:MAG: PEP-CTERM sorting domain-containing protein [bacterium]
MKRLLLSFALSASVLAVASADPFSMVDGYGWATASVYAQTTANIYSVDPTNDQYSTTSLYAGAGGYASFNDYWQYQYEDIIGYDDDGNPIYGTFYEDQYENAYAEASAYGRFVHSTNRIEAEVYSYHQWSYSTTGSYAFASANSSSSSQIIVNFSLTNGGPFRLSSPTSYGDGVITLYMDGNYILDSGVLAQTSTILNLGPGNYQLTGTAGYDGGAEFYVEAVPEPASMAILGLGAAALLRRRRS